MKALHITTAGTVEIVEIEKSTSLAQMQTAVGGYIEMLTLTDDVEMVLDEEGKLKGRPLNDLATRLTRHFAAGLQPEDMIVGDVLLIGNNETDVPAAVVDLLERSGYPLTTKA